jgi:2-hydroxychromene-2-carboxylate isomerase
MRPSIDFWYEFASTYSFLAAERIEALAQERGVEVRWRPFMLGAIFKAQGHATSPFNLFPVKGAYMWRDMERWCARLGLPLKKPNPFPQNALRAARVAAALSGSERAAFSRALFRLEFCEGRQIDDRAVLTEALRKAGIEPGPVLAASDSEDVKAKLRSATEQAQSQGVFGAPTVVTSDGELFWGNDRLEEALDWATGKR